MDQKVLAYTLPDQPLMDSDASVPAFMVWQPQRSMIVLGQSNRIDTAIHADQAENDGIPVFKRKSGGQTVLLSPGTLVVSVRLISDRQEHPQTYFKLINNLIIKSLENLGIANIEERGISDLAIGGKKILGSSIYRKRNRVFYHAVLNVSETPEHIGRYLKYPDREPDYRAGRKHEEFVTSIVQSGYPLTIEDIWKEIETVLSMNLPLIQ